MNSSYEEDETDKQEEKDQRKGNDKEPAGFQERHLHNILGRGNETEAALALPSFFLPDCLVRTTVKDRERPVIAAIVVTDRGQIALYGAPLLTSPRSAFVDLCD